MIDDSVIRWGPQLEQATYKNRQRLYLSEQASFFAYTIWASFWSNIWNFCNGNERNALIYFSAIKEKENLTQLTKYL